jgi:ethanolamine utilization protein EutA (predicted chaperonin)
MFQRKAGDKVICPVRAARWVLKAARAFGTRADDPALSTQHGITSEEIARIVKQAAQDAGLDPERFSTQSVRIGGAIALLNSGADRLVIKLLGRWLANVYEAYSGPVRERSHQGRCAEWAQTSATPDGHVGQFHIGGSHRATPLVCGK